VPLANEADEERFLLLLVLGAARRCNQFWRRPEERHLIRKALARFPREVPPHTLQEIHQECSA
jgi:hypothetical protein